MRDKDDEIIGTRHRYDNRLAMAMLTRADKKAEAYREDERLIAAVSEEFEELVDLIEIEGNAMAFINSRRPANPDYPPEARVPETDFDRIDLYYEHRPYDEGARMPEICDPYPDSAREAGTAPDKSADPA